MTDLPDNDFTQRFIFDDSDARGEMVSLELSYAEVLAKHAYPEPVAQLLGELMAAAALLVGTIEVRRVADPSGPFRRSDPAADDRVLQ